jgi:hypothetical protein
VTYCSIRFSCCSCCALQETKFGRQVSDCSYPKSDHYGQIGEKAFIPDESSILCTIDDFDTDHSHDVQITDGVSDELEHDEPYSTINEVSILNIYYRLHQS